MSQNESKFIRQLKITLLSILGPFVIFVIVSLINDHYSIKNNKEHIKLVEETHVTNDMMIRYVDEFRRANVAMTKAIETGEKKYIDEFNRINTRIDAIIKDMYVHNIRGAKDTVN